MSYPIHLLFSIVLFPFSIQEGKYDEALAKFTTALNTLGFEPHLCYNVALCFYQMKEYAPALKHVGK